MPTPNGGGGGSIPTAPGGTGSTGGGGGYGGSGSSGTGSGGCSGTGSSGCAGAYGGAAGGGGGGGGNYRRKAGKRYLEQAANLEAQARALRRALNHSFSDALQIKLQNVNETLAGQSRTLMDGYRERVASLAGSVADNEKAQASQTVAAGQNRVRERNSAVSEAMAQGAGESDILAAQMMSLNNWQANQNEIQRSLFDTLRSVNSSLTDLNVDTKTGRVNLQAQALADKEQLWTNYYNQRSEAFTQLGNIRGQQADYLDMAKEYGVGHGSNPNAGEHAFMQAAKETGKSWESPGISKKLLRWNGHDDFEASPNGGKLQAAPTVDLGARPEGATLRKWTP